jgi:hypothetical protein
MSATAVLALSLVTILLRLAATRARAGALARIADLTLILAAAVVVAGVADPQGWTTSLVQAPPASVRAQPIDPRLPSHLGLLLALLASLPAACAGAPAVRLLPAIMPGVLLATVAAGALAFLGLHDAFAILATACGAFAAGTALGALFRSAAAAGPGRWRALLVGAASVMIVAATLALYGRRTDAMPVKQDAAAEGAGFGLAFRGLADTTRNPRRLLVELQQGTRLRELRPQLVQEDSARVSARPAGSAWSGPVVAALAWMEDDASAHPFVWLAKGDSLQVASTVVTFRAFRMVPGDPVKFHADLDVRRGDSLYRVSPGLAATRQGSTPFAAQIPGVGPVAVARMDADAGRIAIMMPGLNREPGPSTATLRLQLRPGLEVAWGALGVAILAALLALFSAAPSATPPVAANPD